MCVTACGIMHPRRCRPATSWVHYTTSCNTQSSAPEDGRDQSPKHVELIGIINKPLLLHLVGVYIIYIVVHIIACIPIYVLSRCEYMHLSAIQNGFSITDSGYNGLFLLLN